MSPNFRVDESDVRHVWSNQRSKFIRQDDDLRCGSRQLASLLAFIKHKFHEEFEVFIEGCDVSGVDVFSDILLSSSSADNSKEVHEEDDGKMHPSNEERVGSSKNTTASCADSVNGVVLKEPAASSSPSVRLPSSGVENMQIENRQSEEAVRNVKQRHSNVNHKSGAGNPVSQTSAKTSNPKKPLERIPEATILEIPSPSASSIRLTRLEKRKQLEKECEIQNTNRLRSLKSKVPSKELQSATERKRTLKRTNTGKRRMSNRIVQKVGKSEGNCADSLAVAVIGGTADDFGPSEDSLKSCEKAKGRKAAVPTTKKRVRKTGRQQTRIVSTLDLKCPICKKTFSTRGSLKRHLEIHDPNKKFKCLLCPKAFHQKSNLQTHQRIHTNEKPFKCSFCPKTFRRSFNRRVHELIHQNLKPHKCPFCAKCFRQSPTLRRHKLLHANEKRYSCFVCSKAFRKASQLNRHEEIHRFE